MIRINVKSGSSEEMTSSKVARRTAFEGQDRVSRGLKDL
jgi:hypothetical protein